MTWDESITLSFAAIPQNSQEIRYLGSWNKLLNTLFPPSTTFTVHPKYSLPYNNPVADFIAWFEIGFDTQPVLIVEVTSPSALGLISARGYADLFMRDRFRDYAEMCPIPTLHGISAMGTQIAFYSLDVQNLEADIMPLAIPQNPRTKNDFAPRDRWSLELLSEEGEAQICRIADEIKARCATLK